MAAQTPASDEHSGLAGDESSIDGASAAGDESGSADGSAPGDVSESDPSRIDLTFDKISSMATDSIRKFAQVLGNRSGDTDDSSIGSESVPETTGLPADSPAESTGRFAAPVGALAKVFRDRPELGVIATFAGGLILATLLKRLARR